MVDVKKVTSGFILPYAKGFATIQKDPSVVRTYGTSFPNGLSLLTKEEKDPFVCLQQRVINGNTRYGFKVPFSRIYDTSFGIFLTDAFGGPAFPAFTTNILVEALINIEIYDEQDNLVNNSRDGWEYIQTPSKIEVFYTNNQKYTWGFSSQKWGLFAGDFVTFYVETILYPAQTNPNYYVYSGVDSGIGSPFLIGSLIEITDL